MLFFLVLSSLFWWSLECLKDFCSHYLHALCSVHRYIPSLLMRRYVTLPYVVAMTFSLIEHWIFEEGESKKKTMVSFLDTSKLPLLTLLRMDSLVEVFGSSPGLSWLSPFSPPPYSQHQSSMRLLVSVWLLITLFPQSHHTMYT